MTGIRPRRNVLIVERLDKTKKERAHCARLIRYTNAMYEKEVPKKVLELADKTEARHEIVRKIVDIGENDKDIYLLVKWDGLPDERDFTGKASIHSTKTFLSK